MLSHPPYLSILRPSSSTTLFTVSTASPLQSLSSRLQHYLLVILRILLFLSTLLTLFCKTLPPIPPPSWRASITPLITLVTPIPWTYLIPCSLLSLFLVFRRFHTEESLLTLRTLGIQTRSLSPCYLFPATTRFIPTSQIVDIFIHEAFRGFEVRYYLAVVVEGEGAVVVVFPKLLPSRSIIEHVWRGARECLYEPKSTPPTLPTDI